MLKTPKSKQQKQNTGGPVSLGWGHRVASKLGFKTKKAKAFEKAKTEATIIQKQTNDFLERIDKVRQEALEKDKSHQEMMKEVQSDYNKEYGTPYQVGRERFNLGWKKMQAKIALAEQVQK